MGAQVGEGGAGGAAARAALKDGEDVAEALVVDDREALDGFEVCGAAQKFWEEEADGLGVGDLRAGIDVMHNGLDASDGTVITHLDCPIVYTQHGKKLQSVPVDPGRNHVRWRTATERT